MNTSESIKELAVALSKAQMEMSNPAKNSKNPFFKSSYADLAEVINVSKPHLAEQGLSVVQMPSFSDGVVSVETMLLHESGEYITSTMSIPVSKIDAQGVGAATTYCRRYALAAVCGLAQEDSDAELSMNRNSTKPGIAQAVIKSLETHLANNYGLGFTQEWRELTKTEQGVLWKSFSTSQQKHAKQLLENNK